MAAKLPSARATYGDLLALPKHRVGEILLGALHSHPRPALPHAEVASGLLAEMRGPFQRGRGGPGGWIILDEPELHLGAESELDVVVPDLAGWRRSRMPFVPTEPYSTLPPDWVCEVLSASTEATDRGEKMTIYAREKGEHVWLVDPLIRTLEVFRLDDGTWRMINTWHDDVVVRPEPFDAIPLDLGQLWESLPPRAP